MSRSYRAGGRRSSRSSKGSSSSRSSHGIGTTHVDVAAPPPTVIVDRSPAVVVSREERRFFMNHGTDARSAGSSYSHWDGVWSARLEALTIGAAALAGYMRSKSETDEDDEVDYERELRETRGLMRELVAELASAQDPLLATIERPVDGKYVGESAEEDGGDQAVSTNLIFGRDGIVSGSGFDSVDGDYVVSYGRWAGKRVAWIETYDEGFTVALRGQVRPDGSILALWASSRGVGGSVELHAPKPNDDV